MRGAPKGWALPCAARSLRSQRFAAVVACNGSTPLCRLRRTRLSTTSHERRKTRKPSSLHESIDASTQSASVSVPTIARALAKSGALTSEIAAALIRQLSDSLPSSCEGDSGPHSDSSSRNAIVAAGRTVLRELHGAMTTTIPGSRPQRTSTPTHPGGHRDSAVTSPPQIHEAPFIEYARLICIVTRPLDALGVIGGTDADGTSANFPSMAVSCGLWPSAAFFGAVVEAAGRAGFYGDAVRAYAAAATVGIGSIALHSVEVDGAGTIARRLPGARIQRPVPGAAIATSGTKVTVGGALVAALRPCEQREDLRDAQTAFDADVYAALAEVGFARPPPPRVAAAAAAASLGMDTNGSDGALSSVLELLLSGGTRRAAEATSAVGASSSDGSTFMTTADAILPRASSGSETPATPLVTHPLALANALESSLGLCINYAEIDNGGAAWVTFILRDIALARARALLPASTLVSLAIESRLGPVAVALTREAVSHGRRALQDAGFKPQRRDDSEMQEKWDDAAAIASSPSATAWSTVQRKSRHEAAAAAIAVAERDFSSPLWRNFNVRAPRTDAVRNSSPAAPASESALAARTGIADAVTAIGAYDSEEQAAAFNVAETAPHSALISRVLGDSWGIDWARELSAAVSPVEAAWNLTGRSTVTLGSSYALPEPAAMPDIDATAQAVKPSMATHSDDVTLTLDRLLCTGSRGLVSLASGGDGFTLGGIDGQASWGERFFTAPTPLPAMLSSVPLVDAAVDARLTRYLQRIRQRMINVIHAAAAAAAAGSVSTVPSPVRSDAVTAVRFRGRVLRTLVLRGGQAVGAALLMGVRPSVATLAQLLQLALLCGAAPPGPVSDALPPSSDLRTAVNMSRTQTASTGDADDGGSASASHMALNRSDALLLQSCVALVTACGTSPALANACRSSVIDIGEPAAAAHVLRCAPYLGSLGVQLPIDYVAWLVDVACAAWFARRLMLSVDRDGGAIPPLSVVSAARALAVVQILLRTPFAEVARSPEGQRSLASTTLVAATAAGKSRNASDGDEISSCSAEFRESVSSLRPPQHISPRHALALAARIGALAHLPPSTLSRLHFCVVVLGDKEEMNAIAGLSARTSPTRQGLH